MEESVTYQALIRKGEAKGRAEGEAKGAAEEARRILLRIGARDLGKPDEATVAAIAGILDCNCERGLASSQLSTSSTRSINASNQRRNGGKRR